MDVDVVRYGRKQTHRHAQHAIEAKATAIDIVAEKNKARVGCGFWIVCVRLHFREKVGLHQRGLEARVATMQIA